MAKVRLASHAGSWYSSDPETLDTSLTQWLEAAENHGPPAKAIICPHAGYEFSGPTAAWAYRQIDPGRVKRILLLGPAHHEYISGCALPWANRYQTPLGDIPIDVEAIEFLQSTSAFSQLKARGEKDEHSLEMQLPYLRKVLQGVDFSLIPIVVGEVTPRQQDRFAELLLPYFEQETTVTVISSDFCVKVTQHWGRDFDYTYYNPATGERWQSIQALDRLGMDIIERGDVE